MENVEVFINETDNKHKKRDGPKPVVKSLVDLQRIKLEKLMKNPEKPIIIPESHREKDFNNTIPSFVRNVMGSSAGAGSGEFHVYRHLRRKEYARQKYIQHKSLKEKLDDEYHQKLELNLNNSEEKTAKKRAKRLKKKQMAKKRGKKPKVENNDEDNSSSDDSDDEKSEPNEEKQKDELSDEKSNHELDETKPTEVNNENTLPINDTTDETIQPESCDTANCDGIEVVTVKNKTTE